jgi:hypothetical protein
MLYWPPLLLCCPPRSLLNALGPLGASPGSRHNAQQEDQDNPLAYLGLGQGVRVGMVT